MGPQNGTRPGSDGSDSFHRQIVGDEPAKDDLLGFDTHVKALAEFVTDHNTDPPLTVSIEGVWGSGKSSFMRQLETRLDDDYPVVWFNPWRHEKTTEVWAAFMLAFLGAIRDELPIRDRLAGYVKLLGRRLNESQVRRDLAWKGIVGFGVVVVGVVAIGALGLFERLTLSQLQAIGLFSAGGGLLGLGVWTRRSLDRTESQLRAYIDDPNYADRVPFINQFHEDLEDILDAYVGDRRVFVFIDDLDRCAVPRAAELMQAINLMLSDDSRLVFVIGMDRQKVAAGIAAKHDDTLEFLPDDAHSDGHQFGSDYLEKFIQVPFVVPRPDEANIREFIEAFVNETIDESSGDGAGPSPSVERWNRELLYELTVLVAPYLDYNPRKLKKFLNLYRLRVHLANTHDLLEWQQDGSLTLQQIAKFVAATVQWPRLTDALAADPNLLRDLVAAPADSEGVAASAPAVEYWQAQEGLADLLRAVPESPSAASWRYDLETANVPALLEISPPLRTDEDARSPSALA